MIKEYYQYANTVADRLQSVSPTKTNPKNIDESRNRTQLHDP